ncbi:exonuclease domain-containing protein (plasmid) [Pontibacillus sp. ALD_SL1]|uniref:3'-5' exonuclease n=1 Tax=Pontibacillus sp. ALD_SL1 TaxID=2777185 RepID=UPI001A97AAFB|nr:3'-5' exonuclease [Pontibacillus sp. ALD_SL1]QST02311.1 exonuclease domain-containing protein [Pontibacillus sp. ALD_SL1]
MKRVFFDLEMLCGPQYKCFSEQKTIRLGACLLNNQSKTPHFFDRYVKPDKGRISSYCTRLTGIKNHHMNNAKSFLEVFEEFLSFVGDVEGCMFYAWGNNDIKRLELDLAGTPFQREWNTIRERYVNFQEEFMEIAGCTRSLEYALGLYDQVFIGERHNPKFDAYNTYRIWEKVNQHDLYNSLLSIEERVLGTDSLCIEKNGKDEAGARLSEAEKGRIQLRVIEVYETKLKRSIEVITKHDQNDRYQKGVRKLYNVRKELETLGGNPILSELNLDEISRKLTYPAVLQGSVSQSVLRELQEKKRLLKSVS